MTSIERPAICLHTGLRRQRGILTVFSGVLILVLLTLMMFFATRVGVFEQRVSADDMRQKISFHTAESGIQHTKEYLLAHEALIASKVPNMLADGRDGWLSPGNERWLKCKDQGLDLVNGRGTHPCFGEPTRELREHLYFYSSGGSTKLPINTDLLLPGDDTTVAVEALLCVLVVDFESGTPIQGCSTETDPPDGRNLHYLVTLLARAGADCVSKTCNAEAQVREQVANYGGAAGGNAPAVPLTTRNSFPPSGAAEVVANPNAGGIGVPQSVWMNANESCSGGSQIANPETGSWATCEYHEWYESESIPDGVRCPGSCSCSNSESISNTHGSEVVLGIDLNHDPEFPCDLFKFFFGVSKPDYRIIKGLSQVISDCETLDESSFGIYWVTGAECNIKANAELGSPLAPLLLISAANLTRMNGGATIFGTLYVSDAENPAASVESRGNNIVYGAAIIDATLGSYNGTFQVIYNEKLVHLSGGQGGLGNVLGGWSDFHRDWD
jgi:hypothetical protein